MMERKRDGGPHDHRPVGGPGAGETTPDRDTIVAISTPPGRGGVGVVRLSGPRAEAIGGELFTPAGKGCCDPRVASFGDFSTAAGETIDEGYRVIFRPPRAFTGEETVELWTHGSPAVLRRLVEEAVSLGARPATPGEFTLRAFLNGRIDVTQAEAIRDLIEARTAFQAKVAHDQVKGRISAAVNALKDRLSELVARAEAAIEFSEEAEAERFAPADGILAQVRSVRVDIERLARTFEHGRRVREGSTVALVGSPNVGKSSLFNRLLEEDRAIVTAEPGTTRDRIEETLDLGGIPVVLSDTAGIRPPRDPIEDEAVKRSQGIVARADLLLHVLDWSRPLRDAERDFVEKTEASRCLTVLNKVDLARGLEMDQVLYLRKRHDAIEVSARTGEGVRMLRHRLEERMVQEAATSREEPFITNLRQRDLLLGGAAALRRAEGALRDRLGEEYAMLDMREGLDRLGEITGEVEIEEIYDRIFSTFCIGK